MDSTQIQALAEKHFALLKSPVPRYLLARDVLADQFSVEELARLKAKTAAQKPIRTLQSEQWEDGSWGRLHTQDTQQKQKVATTQVGVARALALGFDARDSLLIRAQAYLLGVLEDKIDYRDRKENHPFFDHALRLICADCISQITPAHPALEAFKTAEVAVLTQAFSSGKYTLKAETKARQALGQCAPGGDPLEWTKWLNTMHAFRFLSTCPVPQDLRNRYMIHVWESKSGLFYVGAPLRLPVPGTLPQGIHRWLDGIEIFSTMPGSNRLLEPVAAWLWQQQDTEGWWNFGKPISRDPNHTSFPYADHWRGGRQKQDWSVRVLRLLKKIME